MSIFDSLGEYITHTIQENWSAVYSNPSETVLTETYEITYVTRVVYDPPLHSHKYILVSEILDYFTDDQLNTVYHTKQEYAQANEKYGYIFKHQKFENADTVQKLEQYAMDWIKNNYHGGLTCFDISAFDLHMIGENVDPYMVGDRINVDYPDPDAQTEVRQTFTCITAEYDLNNPDKNRYKIGIPDVTLNKVYGESSKSGGGGGGGKKDESETDTEDEQEADTQKDKLDSIMEWAKELGFSFFVKQDKDGTDGTTLETPSTKDPSNPFNMNLSVDNLLGGTLTSTTATIKEKLTAGNLSVSSILDAATLKIGGKEFKPSVSNGKVQLKIGDNTYSITPD